MTITIHPFYERSSGSYSYIVANPESRCCAVVDAALGVSQSSDTEPELNTVIADLMLDWISAHQFSLRYILETHVHADRPSAAGYLKSHALCAQTVIGADTPDICGPDQPGGYDRLVHDGEKLCLDHACARVIATPGHTPGCVSYQFDNFIFVGDTLFMPDSGTARCDFPGGNARRLYTSIQKLLEFPAETRLLVCHDYEPDGRRPRFVTTVSEERERNIHVGTHACMDSFVAMRSERDAGLSAPRWAGFSIPANLRCLDLDGTVEFVRHAQSASH